MVAATHDMAWSAERCASLLGKAKRSPTGWKACCPAHEDKDPSLFLADGDDGGLVLVCYANCDYRSVAHALEAKGAVVYRGRQKDEPRQAPPTQNREFGKVQAFWDYRDANGRHVLRICRWDVVGADGQPKKEIRPLYRDPVKGWSWTKHPDPAPLFQLERLTNEPFMPVLVVEGEKAAIAAQTLFPGYVATTWPGGASTTGKADWTPLKGRHVVLVPDNDNPGRTAMRWVQTALKESAASVRVVDPAEKDPQLPPKWDLADALKEGRDVSGWLDPEPSKEPEPPRLIKAGFTAQEAKQHLELPYLVKGLFDRGQIVVMWGAPGSGKTFSALHLGAHIGAGIPWNGRRVKRGLVFYICAESTRPRLENRVWALRQRYPELENSHVFFVPVSLDLLHGEKDIEDVTAACKELAKSMGEVALVVVDTLAVTFGGGNENDAADMGQYVTNIKRIRDLTGAAVMVVHHCGKDEAKGMRGHSSLLGALDAELVVEKIQNPTTGWPSRMLRSGKVREDASDADLMGFDLEVRTIGHDSDGDPVTTCVVAPVNPAGGGSARRPEPGKQAELLTALEKLHQQGTIAWTEAEIRGICKAEEIMHRNSVKATLVALVENKFLKQAVGGYMLTYPPAEGSR